MTYSSGNLYSMRYGAYSVVIASRTAEEACRLFESFLKDRGISTELRVNVNIKVNKVKGLGNRDLFMYVP